MSLLDDPKVACPPRWATPRNPDRPTYGDQAAEVAGHLGFELLPWQRQVLDVGLEYDPDTGRLCYLEVIHSEPRHSGKTTLTLTRKIWRATMYAKEFGPQILAYSAQSGKDARLKMVGDRNSWANILEDSKWMRPQLGRIRRGAGDSAIPLTNGSVLYPLSGTDKAGHGEDIHDGDVDEAWNDQTDAREQAILPGQSTIPDAQLWVYSTKGYSTAYYLHRKIEMGRALVESGEPSDIAYFEWSAPDDCDADDEDIWAQAMPGLGYIQTLRTVRHARKTMKDGEFRRAFLNMQTATAEAALPWNLYQSRCSPDVAPSGSELHVALDCTPDREYGCIAVGSRVDGGTAVELVENRSGLAWILDDVKHRASKRQPEKVLLQGSGPLAVLAADLEAAGIPVTTLTQPEMAVTSAWFYDAVVDGSIGIRTHPDLDAAVQGARKLKMGDSFRWARMSPTTNAAPLVAVSMAGWSAHTSTGGHLWMHT